MFDTLTAAATTVTGGKTNVKKKKRWSANVKSRSKDETNWRVRGRGLKIKLSGRRRRPFFNGRRRCTRFVHEPTEPPFIYSPFFFFFFTPVLTFTKSRLVARLNEDDLTRSGKPNAAVWTLKRRYTYERHDDVPLWRGDRVYTVHDCVRSCVRVCVCLMPRECACGCRWRCVCRPMDTG